MHTLSRFWRFAVYVIRRFSAHGCMLTAAALTFETLLALVPALTLMLGVFATTSYFSGFAESFHNFLYANLVPYAAGRVTRMHVEQFVQDAGRLTLVGTLLLTLSVFALVMLLDRSLNAIWQIKQSRPLWWRVFHGSLWIFGGPLLIGVVLSFGGWLISYSLGGSGILSEGEKFLLRWMPCLFNAVALALFYRVTPRAHVPWMHAVATGILIALVLEAMKGGFSAYVRYVVSYQVIYGAFAGFPVFLLWLYACWIAVLAGAVITAAWPYWLAPPAHALPSLEERIALTERVLSALDEANKITIQRLVRITHAGYDELAYVLDQLDALGLIRTGDKIIVRLDAPGLSHQALADYFLRMPSELR